MNPRRLIAALAILSLLLTQSSFASEKLLLGKDYFTTVHKALEEAQDSIYVAMYIISVPESGKEATNPAAVLLNDLIKAKDRGVRVKVVLDDTKFNVNYRAFRKLKSAGVDVELDSPGKLMHGKGIVIDERLVIIGSTNWTRASIYDNHEFSYMLDSPEAAKELASYISAIKLNPDVPLFPDKVPGVNLASSLLTDSSGLSPLLTNHAERAFDLYLYIIKNANSSSLRGGAPSVIASPAKQGEAISIPINYKELAEYLGYTRNYYFSVRQPLNSLVRKYKLINHKPWSKYLSLRSASGGEAISLPNTYWLHGYDKSLSFPAKYLYLISLNEARASDRNPYWFRSVKDLALKYHIGERTVSKGLNELEKANIVEVYRHTPFEPGNFADRPANIYRINALTSAEEFEANLNKLNEKYGQDPVTQARALSTDLNEPRDIVDIETFIRLIDEYGYAKVKSITDEVASKRLETGFRSIERVVLLLKQN